MRLDGFVGNDHAVQLLASYVDSGRLPQALLLEGPAGSGKRTLCRLLAKAALCGASSEAEKPCGVCAACVKAEAGNHPDWTQAGSDGSARSFHIDVIRTIRETAYIVPNEAPRRVFSLIEAQNLTEQAQNALLKILEEPPGHVLFLLTCENRAQLLPTIRSRAVCVPLGAVTQEEALHVLRERRPDLPEETLSRAAALSGGIIGQALRGLEDDTFQQAASLTEQIVCALLAPDELTLLRLTPVLDTKDKRLLDAVLSGLRLAFRDALIGRFGGHNRLSVCPEAADGLSHALGREQLMRLLTTTENLQQARSRNMNTALLLTLLCARLRQAAGK